MPVTPLEAATDVLDRAKALLALETSTTAEDVRTDIRRLARSMASASIDTFLHWRVARVDLYAPLPKELRKLDIPFGDLSAMARADVLARQQNVANKPIVKARNVLRERIIRDTYQSSRGVETALKMCGVSDCWSKLGSDLGEKKSDIIDHLNTLAHRRNAIVHEGDIQRKSKPHHITHQPLKRTEIDNELAWVRDFVEAMSRIV
ncbi:hypothetical protein [Curtobacterium sp. MCBD17_040]|uniref:hypothetical protein n=1 Tax=Curtobacterium sp. MCBD17_040 TaxID=2175674 RepID=UPI0011B7D303|nr:hypothetical protein [Curtobacterium sp. MCBD17_040]WIB64035.1 hypothetical protein DEI94_02235 [Curtobacterium sp. MCBD17_040]